MKYHSYELAHTMLRPWRAQTQMLQRACSNPLNPAAYTDMARKLAASCQVFESVTRRYGKPAWGLHQTSVVGQPVPIQEEVENCRKKHAPKIQIRGGMDPEEFLGNPSTKQETDDTSEQTKEGNKGVSPQRIFGKDAQIKRSNPDRYQNKVREAVVPLSVSQQH